MMQKLFMHEKRIGGSSRCSGSWWIMFVSCLVLFFQMIVAFPVPSRADEKHEENPFRSSNELIRRLFEERAQLDRTVWKPEVLAQTYETPFIRLWDDLRLKKDRYAVLRSFPFRQIWLPRMRQDRVLEHEIEVWTSTKEGHWVDHDAFASFLDALKKQGYRIVQSEWHHQRFIPGGDRVPRQSEFNFEIHVLNSQTQERLMIKGSLGVVWGKIGKDGVPEPDTLHLNRLTLLRRKGVPWFTEWQILNPPPNRMQIRLHEPVLVTDLNGDGYPEIILAGSNNLYWNRKGQQLVRAPWLTYPPNNIKAAVVADFTGDGILDAVVAGAGIRPLLYRGRRGGSFPDPPEMIKAIPEPLSEPSHMTAGDVDRDGDLDLYIAQYKPAYVGGQMPRPFYDANDGYPAYFLENIGNGRFVERTEAVGLGKYRFRRTYSVSFVDLDDDGDLDLLVVSDYSGVDIYENDGRGYFTRVTDRTVDERHNFGMAHTFADFNGDGLLDFYVIGMSSTTARRLEALKLGRKDFPDYNRMRPVMGYGNRMYLNQGRGRYRQPIFKDEVARSGWSWGVTAQDFDRDGDVDIYVANGHFSGKTARDYCTYFWRHDIYTVTDKPSATLEKFFAEQFRKLSAGEISWNGFEHNHLFLNLRGQHFINTAFLMGVAFEFDGGAVIGADLNRDGRPDLITTEVITAEQEVRKIHVLLNQQQSNAHWIGVELRSRDSVKALGAKLRVAAGGQIFPAVFVTGDSFRAQHPFQRVIGLGPRDAVDWLEIQWADGCVQKIKHPPVNTYIRLSYRCKTLNRRSR